MNGGAAIGIDHVGIVAADLEQVAEPAIAAPCCAAARTSS
jgi:hypothetical protein